MVAGHKLGARSIAVLPSAVLANCLFCAHWPTCEPLARGPGSERLTGQYGSPAQPIVQLPALLHARPAKRHWPERWLG